MDMSEAVKRKPADIAEQEWQLRLQLAACYRVFHHMGWTELIWNHITLRVPGPEKHYLINPFGLNYDEVTATNLVKVGLDGVPVSPTRYGVNRAGFVIHSAIHAVREDAHCIMHTHTDAGMAVAGKKDGLSHDNFYGAILYGAVAYHDFEGITVHTDEQPRLVKSLGDKRVLILRNHGLLVCHHSVPAAFRLMWTLQRACEAQCKTDAMSGENLPLPDAVKRSSVEAAATIQPSDALDVMIFDSVLRAARLSADDLV